MPGHVGLVEQKWLEASGWLATWGGTPYLVLGGALAACACIVLLVRLYAGAVDEKGEPVNVGLFAVMSIAIAAMLLMFPPVNARLMEAARGLSNGSGLVDSYRQAVRAILGT